VKSWEAWTVHLATVLVAATGAVYAVMRYLMAPSDPYAVVNHPLQPSVQHLHVLAAPFLVFGAGLIWREHVWKHYRQGVRSGRRSGVWMLPTLLPMVVSGYLIQTTVSDGWRTAWIAVHLAASALWLAGYAGHTVAAVQRRAARRERDRTGEPGCVEPPLVGEELVSSRGGGG
jgi:hypothetical protein